MPRRPVQHDPRDRRRAMAGAMVTALAFALALLESGALPPIPAEAALVALEVKVSVGRCGERSAEGQE